MAVALMKPRDPIAHRMDHDLESVCYVLLHIVRFSLGPVGTRLGGTRKSHRVAWWHHTRDIKVIKDNKGLDRKKIIKHPERYLSDYWRPVAPYVKKILKLFPAKKEHVSDAKIDSIYTKFRQHLVDALNHCRTLNETPFPYAAFGPDEPMPADSRKRTRPDGMDGQGDLRKSKRHHAQGGSHVQSSMLINSNAMQSSSRYQSDSSVFGLSDGSQSSSTDFDS